jgi:hypothetical protein
MVVAGAFVHSNILIILHPPELLPHMQLIPLLDEARDLPVVHLE